MADDRTSVRTPETDYCGASLSARCFNGQAGCTTHPTREMLEAAWERVDPEGVAALRASAAKLFAVSQNMAYYREHKDTIEPLVDELIDRFPDVDDPAELFAAIVTAVASYPDPARVRTMFALCAMRLIAAKRGES